MHELTNTDDRDSVDWAGTCRLALVVSVVAAFAALLLAGVMAETTLIVSIIVAATAVSWFQLERRPARTHSHL